MRRTRVFMALSLLLTAVSVVSASSSSTAAPSSTAKEQHCVIRVLDQKESGELVTTDPQCFKTFDEAQRSTRPGDGAMSAASDYAIGIHYDGASFTGSSMTVMGSNCWGGWINTSASWANRISSTLNGCPTIAHYDGYGLSGGSEYVSGGGGNLIWLNNATQSLQYLG